MAHTCPYCGCYCTCSGDWDDIDLGIEPTGGCVHYLSENCEYDRQDDEDWGERWDDEGLEDPPKTTN